MISENVLKNEEKTVFGLCSLYNHYGYAPYKMSKFEEYDLYMRNKDFLVSDHVIAFTDTNGKLLALKPDVTLSIIKNFGDEGGKVFYNENVYRVSESSGAFREIMQVGLECMGEIDDYQIYEVLLLAAKSLALISSEYVLDISHLGVISGLLDDLGLTGNERQTALKCVGEKNAHGLQQLLDEKNCGQKADAELLLELVKTSGKPAEMWRKLDGKLGKSRQNEWNLLRKLCEELDKAGVGEHLRLDFSVVNDMNYYNGIVFKGFVQSLPSGILSGGQYDKLMTKMHKSCGGIGFAVYLDQLAWMEHDRDPYDVDTVLLYSERTPLSALSARVAELTGQGERVLTRKTQPENLRCRRVCSMEEKEDMSVGTNA